MRPSRPPEPPPPIEEATEYGAYTLLERVGVGGMAEVFRAQTQPAAGAPRTVVVKRMLPHIAAERGSAQMFAEEARLGACVEHPNVVRVLDHGVADGRPYLVLELVPGKDLARLMRSLRSEGRQLPASLALYVATELLAGLHAVHEARDAEGLPLGIVHGDVSPSNVLLSTDGDVKLADFGIAEARLRKSFPQAAAGRTRGKLGYLSPEQVRGAPNDRRSDVFAASVVAAELLVGEPLFARESELSTLLAVRDAKVGPLIAKTDAMPTGVVETLLRGLASDPANRFEDAAQMREELLAFLDRPPAALREALGEVTVEATGGAIPDSDGPSDEDMVTMEPPLQDYFVERNVGGQPIGPLTFAQLVEAVTTGRVAPNDRVRRGDGPARSVHRISELDGYFPDAPTLPPPDADHAISIGTGAFLDALAGSVAERATGVWICAREEVRKEIYLVEGTPEFVSSNLPDELLGEFLVTKGELTRGELDMALAVLERFDGRLGDTLTALGLLEPVELFRHIGAQVREKLLELFTWDSGSARFHEDVSPPQRYFPLGLDAWHVISSGIERRLEAGLEQEMFAAHMMDSLARARAFPPEGLPGEVLDVLERTRQPTPLQEVVDALEDPHDHDRHRPYRAIRLAMALGLVHWSTPDDA